jgi:hypothetical protein
MFKKRSDKPLDGRKYRMGIIMMFVLLAGFGLAGLNPVLTSLYTELITGCSLLYFTYCSGNVSNKLVTARKKDDTE